MMSNGTPLPASRDAIAIDAQPRLLFPLERAPPPPRNEGCTLNGFSDPAPLQSNGSLPPSPPIIMMSPLPSSCTTSSKCVATSPSQTVFDKVIDAMKRLQEEIRGIRLSSLQFTEDMKEMRKASRQFGETLRSDVNIFRPERLIKDKTTRYLLKPSFGLKRSMTPALLPSMPSWLRLRTTRWSMKRPAS
jgi:hypothetical protein